MPFEAAYSQAAHLEAGKTPQNQGKEGALGRAKTGRCSESCQELGRRRRQKGARCDGARGPLEALASQATKTVPGVLGGRLEGCRRGYSFRLI